MSLAGVAAGVVDAPICLDPALGEGYVAQQHVIGSDDASYQLACVSSGVPLGDSWLSIAKSFDLQPEE